MVDWGSGIKAAAISDLHLGHNRCDTKRMIESLDKSLIASGLMKVLDILFITGDVFDHLLDLSDPNVARIDRWINRLFKTAVREGVKIRVLKGTPSHDHQQPERFKLIHDITKSECDFKYFNDTDIEFIEDMQMSVLYIPDEARPTTQETQEVVKAKLEALGIEQVDIACMHGFFKHQLPYAVKEHTYHDASYYESIVRDWVIIGHVHTHSRVGKIVAPSSHDRLRQGEEDPKGFVAFSLKAAKPKLWFIENTDAHTFKTIDCTGLDVDAVFLAVEKVLVNEKHKAHIRIEAESNHPIFAHMQALQAAWPLHAFDKTTEKKSKTIEQQIIDESEEVWKSIRIDSSNIVDLILERMSVKYTPDLTKRCLEHLKEFV